MEPTIMAGKYSPTPIPFSRNCNVPSPSFSERK